MDNSGIEIPIYFFGKRLEHLMNTSGFDTKERGINRKLSKEMHERQGKNGSPVLPFNPILAQNEKEKDYLLNKSIDNCRKVIDVHRRAKSAPSTEWIIAYCNFFNCSADYLLGYIDSPTHESADIEQATGLSEDAVAFLITHHIDAITAASANDTPLEEHNLDTFSCSIGLLFSQLIEESPDEVMDLFRCMTSFLTWSDDSVTGTNEREKRADRLACSDALYALLTKASKSERFKKLSRYVLTVRTVREMRAFYNAQNPHKNSPEA